MTLFSLRTWHYQKIDHAIYVIVSHIAHVNILKNEKSEMMHMYSVMD